MREQRPAQVKINQSINNCIAALQGIEQVTVAPQGMPRSQSHMNLRQGLERISADSQPEADSSAPAVATAGQLMRRTKSKLGLDTLASVESMNCPIIDYSQLEIKRKIGDGSVGQVSTTTITNRDNRCRNHNNRNINININNDNNNNHNEYNGNSNSNMNSNNRDNK